MNARVPQRPRLLRQRLQHPHLWQFLRTSQRRTSRMRQRLRASDPFRPVPRRAPHTTPTQRHPRTPRPPAGQRLRRPPLRQRLQIVGVGLLAIVGIFSLIRVTSPAHAESTSYLRGPAPTATGFTASRGPLPIAAAAIPAWAVNGFAGGTVYYPTDTTHTYGGVAMIPGYATPESSLDWLGPRVASEGFVVLTVAPLHLDDYPEQRSTELLAALDYLTHHSPVRSEVDPNRLAVLGHSMGGGGSLQAASRAATTDTPDLKAVVALDPWDPAAAWPHDGTPTLIITAQGDSIAPTATMAEPDYAGIPATAHKALLELRGGNHFTPFLPNPYTVEYTISWLKRFVDNDPRYNQFLCPGPVSDPAVGAYRATCPM